VAFWQSGDLPAAARAVRDWARVDAERPTPHRFAARIYEDMRAFDLARDSALRETACAPGDASAWERLGRLRLRLGDRDGAREALEHARGIAPTMEGLLDLALVHQLSGEIGAEVTACEAATLLAPESSVAWSRYAHALARTDRVSDAIEACEHALQLGRDPEVMSLLGALRERAPRVLPAESAA
jgi:cytochrome c-type biogenesis protein CcmH/NrfG